jgi:hypothetical protein
VNRSTLSLWVLSTLLMSQHAWSAESRFELAPRLGYAGTFTTGLSPYGAFVALGVGARPIRHLWVATSVFSYGGASAAGDGPDITYRAHDRAYALALDATWRFDVGPLFIEPGAEVGAAWILGSTYVTPAQVTDRYVVGNVGLTLRLAVHVGHFAYGVEGAGLFVPSTVAAPVLRGAAFVLVPF